MKIKIKTLAFLLLGAGLFQACASSTNVTKPHINVVVKPGITFSKDASITIVRKNAFYDGVGAEGILTNQLMMHGFNVVSNSLAKTALKFSEDTEGSDQVNKNVRGEMYSETELNSDYILEFEGDSYLDILPLPQHYDYTSFSASVIDLGTGEIVVSANFVGNKPVLEVCTEFVNLMVSHFQ